MAWRGALFYIADSPCRWQLAPLLQSTFQSAGVGAQSRHHNGGNGPRVAVQQLPSHAEDAMASNEVKRSHALQSVGISLGFRVSGLGLRVQGATRLPALCLTVRMKRGVQR